MSNSKDYVIDVQKPGTQTAEATSVMGGFLIDVMKLNWETRNFSVFGPDKTASNRQSTLFVINSCTSVAEIYKTDDHISTDGRVMGVLSEQICQGGRLFSHRQARHLFLQQSIHSHFRCLTNMPNG